MTSDLSNAALEIYAKNADILVERYEAVDAEQLLARFAGHFPQTPADVLDAGAGTGRDAAWFAAQGHRVTAVEPTDALRAAGVARHGAAISWRSDTLPDLAGLDDGRFDLVLVNAVWHHLSDGERDTAIARLAGLLRPEGRLIVSLRHGPDHAGQSIARLSAEAETARAGAAGLRVVDRVNTDAVQDQNRAAGVSWTWLILAREIAT